MIAVEDFNYDNFGVGIIQRLESIISPSVTEYKYTEPIPGLLELSQLQVHSLWRELKFPHTAEL